MKLAIFVGLVCWVGAPAAAGARGTKRGAKRRASGLKRSGKKPVCSPDSVTDATKIKRLKAKLQGNNAATQRTALFRLGFCRRAAALEIRFGSAAAKRIRRRIRAKAARP